MVLVSQPCSGEVPQLHTLTSAEPDKRQLIFPGTLACADEASCLDLDEHEHASVGARLWIEGDQVDLATRSAHVALEHGEAAPAQVLGGELLATAPKRVSGIARDAARG